jgi:type II secretory pathway pseudopilin PulG
MKYINDFWPTLVVVLVMILLASVIIWNSNRNQQKVIDTVKQAQQERERQVNATLEAIRKQLKDDDAWQRLRGPLEESLLENR